MDTELSFEKGPAGLRKTGSVEADTYQTNIKGILKTPTFVFRSDRNSKKNNLSKIEKTGSQSQQAEGPLAAPCFSIFEISFFGTLFPATDDCGKYADR